MRILHPDVILEKNRLTSDHPFVYLITFSIRTQTEPDIFTNYNISNSNEPISFNSITYAPFPCKFDSLSENASGELTKLSLSVGNDVDQQVISLLELYWKAVLIPLWDVSIWIVDATQPALTPVNSCDVYSVFSAQTNLITTTFELSAESGTLNTIVPCRSYTTSNGFTYLVRKLR